MGFVSINLCKYLLLADLTSDVEDPELVHWILGKGAPDHVLNEVSLEVSDTVELFETHFASLEIYCIH